MLTVFVLFIFCFYQIRFSYLITNLSDSRVCDVELWLTSLRCKMKISSNATLLKREHDFEYFKHLCYFHNCCVPFVDKKKSYELILNCMNFIGITWIQKRMKLDLKYAKNFMLSRLNSSISQCLISLILSTLSTWWSSPLNELKCSTSD